MSAIAPQQQTLNMNKVTIVNYDPSWSELFAQEASHLRNLLGEALVLRIEHVGSTAIPGMPAKPIIDMLVAIPSFEQAQQALPKLEAQGYLYIWRGDRPPGHMMFIKQTSAVRTHHLHMAPEGHKLWERLYFRDYLCTHPEEAARYAQLKRKLAQQFPTDREAYTNGKSAYVQTITSKARAEIEA